MLRHILSGHHHHSHHKPHHHHHHHSSGYHHHHHHNDSGSFLFGAMVGATLSSPPRTEVIIIETPEQIAARREKQRIAEIQRQEQLRAQQLFEDEQENGRIRNIQAHQHLIRTAFHQDIDAFKQMINDLPPLASPIPRYNIPPDNGIPMENGQHLFSMILDHQALNDTEKASLLTILIEQKNYRLFTSHLAQEPCYPKMFQGPACSRLFSDLYIKNRQLHTPPNTPNNALERGFWRHFIASGQNQADNALRLFQLLRGNRTKQLQLLTDWIQAQPSATATIHAYNALSENRFNLNYETKDILLKIAKQRILRFELDNRRAENNDDVREFLDRHRGYWTSWFACFSRRRSLSIHHLIANGQIDQAETAWNQENQNCITPFFRRNQLS